MSPAVRPPLPGATASAYNPAMLHLLRRADVYDPAPRGLQDVLVGNGRVVWMGADLPALPDALDVQEVDLDGRRLVPGFIDGHVHLTGGGGEAGPHTRVPRLMFGDLTRAGVTTVVGVLGTDGTTRTVRDLLATTYGLRAEGLSAYCYTGSYEVPPVTLTGRVRDDLVFLEPVVGVGEVAISDHRSSQPTLAELARLAADAHVSGLMTGKAGLLHLHLGDGPRGLSLVRELLDTTELPARCFHPTHVNRNRRLFDEAKALTARGVTVDVTAYDGADDGVDAATAITELLDAQVPPDRVTVSSDGGGCIPTFGPDGRVCTMDVGRPSALGFTLRQLLAAGQPLERVLPVFTSSVAQLFRWPSKGRVAVGCDADLVALDARGDIHDVMAQGRWVVREGRSTVLGTFERHPR